MNKVNSVFIGTISIHPRGFGFVAITHENDNFDIFIPRKFTMCANTGDIVKALCTGSSDKGYEGELIEVLERKENTLVGYVKKIKNNGDAYLYVPHLGFKQTVILTTDSKKQQKNIKHGDIVRVDVSDWGKDDDIIYSKLNKHLGSIFEPKCDIDAISAEFKIASEFDAKINEEIANIDSRVDINGREDLRHLNAITIDPCGARDHDDAISLEIDDCGNYILGVHIADVAHYVKKDSQLDLEAFNRCNSSYFIDKCIPMLPTELSNGLCSLKTGEDRYTVSIIMIFDKKGVILSHKIKRSVINCRHGFTYKQAKDILDGKTKSDQKKILLKLKNLALILKNKRIKRGSVDLAIPELKLHLDKEGFISDFEQIEYDITHQMIEEFMLKANEVVATHLTEKDCLLTYRIHNTPLGSDFDNLINLASTIGYKLNSNPTPQDINRMLYKLSNHPIYSHLVITFIRSLPFAYYSADNVGHYGLGLENYCHFTSPIRRYSDLVVQRILFDEYKPTKGELKEISATCSIKERASSQAEEKLKFIKKLRYLKKSKKEFPGKSYPATITKINSSGIIFEVDKLILDGFLHISRLSQIDNFYYDLKTLSLKCKNSERKFIIGQKIELFLYDIDLITLDTKWDLCQ